MEKNNGVPRLCGGTFFTQILESKKETATRRQRTKGESDVIHNEDVLFALLQIANPDAIKPSGTSFESYTSNFKKCEGSIGEDLKFDDKNVRAAFEKRIADSYLAELHKMAVFCDAYIDIRETPKNHEKLVKRLIELIRDDKSIENEVMFRVDNKGTKLNKKVLPKVNEVSLPDFLLSVWAYVVAMGNNNSVGKDTVTAWYSNAQNVKGRYNGIDGSTIRKDIKVDCSAVLDATNNVECQTNEDKPFTTADDASAEQPDPFVEDEIPKSTTNQMINNGFLFQQFGNNNKQIVGNVGTLIINND